MMARLRELAGLWRVLLPAAVVALVWYSQWYPDHVEQRSPSTRFTGAGFEPAEVTPSGPSVVVIRNTSDRVCALRGGDPLNISQNIDRGGLVEIGIAARGRYTFSCADRPDAVFTVNAGQ
ncbi:hypothetical protein ACTMSW_08690 [Micromonospora sp. BQ11]|uniref:hypothetical protein n=1 Tax=Micromonospora sp. BQ11 TaxID=3452212 RepID=UPI003F8CD611